MKGTLSFVVAFACLLGLAHTRSARADNYGGWDSSGWVMLGEREAHGHREHTDSIDVGRREGRFSKISIVVLDADLEMYDFSVQFTHGDPWHPEVKHFFKEGRRSRQIDLPDTAYGSDGRTIQRVDFSYKNIPGEGHARVQVWGLPAEPPRPKYTAPSWDSRGWVMLGERELQGRGNHERGDSIAVGRQEGRFNKLTIVMYDADAELIDFNVVFEHGDSWHPSVNHYFREGQRTHAFEVPTSAYGRDARAIKSIEFRYRNTPEEGHARIQIWGQREPEHREWNSDGWQMLGEREVRGHGREVKDRIEVGRGEGKFSQMTIVVLDSDLEIIGMSVAFGHGDPWRPELRHEFREGQRARAIDFPTSERGSESRTIRWIDFTYRNLPGEGHARVQVWAR